MEQHHELWHNALYLIGDEYLVAEELDAVAVELIVLDLREVEHTSEVEWEVNIEVDPEQRIWSHRVEVVVELEVILVLQISWSLDPERGSLIDLIILLSILLLAILPFGRAFNTSVGGIVAVKINRG